MKKPMELTVCGYSIPTKDVKIQKAYKASDGWKWYIEAAEYGYVIWNSPGYETYSHEFKNNLGAEKNFEKAYCRLKDICDENDWTFEEIEPHKGYDVKLTEEESEEESEEDYSGDLYTYQNLLKIKIVNDYTFYMYYFDFDKGVEVEPINCHIKNIEYDINGLIKNIYFEDEDEEIRFSSRDLYQGNEDLKNTMISEFHFQSCLAIFESSSA